MLSFDRSKELFSEAQKVMPGGVNSPVRSFRAVADDPVFIARGEGSRLYDVDGNAYIDYVLSWGPLILGHAHPRVVQALEKAVRDGTSYGAPTEREVRLAEIVTALFPGMDQVRMVNSGTEATMSAIRVARGFTGRSKIVKFVGCYHGHADYLLVKAGSGALTLGTPDSPGVTEGTAADTLTVPFNDLEAVREVFDRYPDDIAAVIIEPVAGNMGVVPPVKGFLEGLREITRAHDTVLIFDEVMTGFRVGFPGAQTVFGIEPDMTTLGKVVGGGLPVGAYGGRSDIMRAVSPTGPVYQAGTLAGNPLAMAAGIATLEVLMEEGTFDKVVALTDRLSAGIRANLKKLGLDYQPVQQGTMFGLFFTDQEVVDYDTATSADTERFARYFSAMLREGIYIAPSQFEAGFMSLAHSEEDVDCTIEANYRALEAL